MTERLGEKLSPILKEISDSLWDHDFESNFPKGFVGTDLLAACKIFSSVVMDVMWANRSKDRDLEFLKAQAGYVGGCIRELVSQSCGVDLHEMQRDSFKERE